jgi:hypothetical protein
LEFLVGVSAYRGEKPRGKSVSLGKETVPGDGILGGEILYQLDTFD